MKIKKSKGGKNFFFSVSLQFTHKRKVFFYYFSLALARKSIISQLTWNEFLFFSFQGIKTC